MRIALRLFAGCCALVAFAQTARLPIDDAKARVTRVTTPYTLSVQGQYGAVWIALDDAARIGDRKLRAGAAEAVKTGTTLEFTGESGRAASLLIIQVKTMTHPLAVNTVVLDPKKELRDKAQRYDTLLVAITPLELRDVTNVGDDLSWHSGEPETISLQPGEAQWLTAEMHRLRNLAKTTAKFVTVEW